MWRINGFIIACFWIPGALLGCRQLPGHSMLFRLNAKPLEPERLPHITPPGQAQRDHPHPVPETTPSPPTRACNQSISRCLRTSLALRKTRLCGAFHAEGFERITLLPCNKNTTWDEQNHQMLIDRHCLCRRCLYDLIRKKDYTSVRCICIGSRNGVFPMSDLS